MEMDVQFDQHKTARARIRGERLIIKIPRGWPEREKQRAIQRFSRWAETHALPAPVAPPPPADPDAFRALVETINRETFDLPINGVRLGNARWTRLAQINLKTRTLTFSRFAVEGMPEQALRYLVIHELAHLLVPNHSKAFWHQVSLHEPDFRRQRRIAQDHFRRAAHRAEEGTENPFIKS